MDTGLQVSGIDAAALSLTLSGIGSRSYAFLIDWLWRTALALAWVLGVGLLVSLIRHHADPALPSWAGSAITLIPAVLIYFLYHPVLEVLMQGRTPGKRAAGIRIVTAEGRAPGAGRLLVRNLFRIIDFLPGFYALGFGLVLLTPRGTRLGDLTAGTLLVHERGAGARRFRLDLADPSGLDVATLELLQELVERWGELEPAARRETAAGLLQRAGVPGPAGASEPQQLLALQALLRRQTR